MLKKDKPMMSVTAIIQGAQAQHWGRGLPGKHNYYNESDLRKHIQSIRIF